MFSDDMYIDALGRQASALDRAVRHHTQVLMDGMDDESAARAVAFETGLYREMMDRATAVQLIVHAAERAQAFPRR